MDEVPFRRLLAPRRIASIFKELIAEVVDDRMTGLAAEVAFFAVLSIFPGFLMIASGLGSLEGLLGSEIADEAESAVRSFMNRMLTSDASQAIQAVRDLFDERRSGLLTFSVIGALAALTRGFTALIRALDIAYDLTERRTWIRQRLMGVGLALGSVLMTVVILAMFVAGPLLGGGQALADRIGVGETFALFWDWLRWPVSFAVLVAWANATFHFGPNQKTAWVADLPGAILTSILWVVVSLGFSVYLRVAADFNQVLGILGGGLILLVWLYLLSIAFLLGAELNAILAGRARQMRPVRD
jgi:membrane protein